MSNFSHISELVPDPHNANKGTQRGRGMLERSLRENGVGRSILLDRNGKIIAGNKTTEAAMDLGIEDVIVVPSDGTKLIAVQRTDLDLDTDPRAARLAIADNRVAQVDLDWDLDVMASLNDADILEGYFTTDELDKLFEANTDEGEEADGEVMPQRADLPEALYPSDNEWGIPMLDVRKQAEAAELPIMKWGVQGRSGVMRGTYHFYTDDYKFNALWYDPTTLLKSRCACIVEPNFSTVDNMPLAVVLWRVFQKRWLSRYWQENGIKVFVDLNVLPQYRELNMLGVPRGWRSYATRVLVHERDLLEEDYQAACEHAETDDIRFLVVGGNASIGSLCGERGWVWIGEGHGIGRKPKEQSNGTQ